MKKQILKVIFLSVFVCLFLVLAIFKDDVMGYVSENKAGSMVESKRDSLEHVLSGLYNYRQNGGEYRYTFLEFGSTSCAACRKMQDVMKEIRAERGGDVNVVFINAGEKENQDIMEYFGIVMIPSQVLLDSSGREYYRHTGYISADELQVFFEK